jgi:hypothetical protein
VIAGSTATRYSNRRLLASQRLPPEFALKLLTRVLPQLWFSLSPLESLHRRDCVDFGD